MRSLELKIPPVAFWLVTAALMGVATWAVPGVRFALPASRVVAAGLLVIGAGISVLGVISFRRAKTTVNPLQPAKASALVATGIYRVSRNPMYLGFLVSLLGWAILLSNPIAFLLLPLFVLGMNRWQIVPEEQALALRFGPEFAAYKVRTRRWL